MNEQLKKRLVGAIVLVALAVIFVPMLLEGDKRAGIPLFGSNVPEPPASPVTTIDIPLQMPPQPAPAPVAVEREPLPEPVAAAPVTAAEPAAPAVPVAPEVPAVQAPTPVSVPQPKPAAPVRQATIPSGPRPAATASWAVQVGAFSEAANATRLRDSLRSKGYPAYMEQMKLNGSSSYRVRVGPVLSRSDAESIQTKLAKIDQRGIVVPHP